MSIISRREAIKKSAIMLGGTLAIPNILKAWTSPVIENRQYAFTPANQQLIAEIAETIVPPTDTPGAKAAGVPAFIEKMVADCYEEEDRTKFMKGLEAIDLYARQTLYRGGFADCIDDQKDIVLRHFEKLYMDDKKANPWWGMIKDLTVTGYFTSEIGCTQALRYEAVPGRYDGAFPYQTGDRAFAT